MADRASGLIQWYNRIQGVGYIDGDDGREVRVGRQSIKDGSFVVEGLRVTYVPVEDESGWHAEHLTIDRQSPGDADHE